MKRAQNLVRYNSAKIAVCQIKQPAEIFVVNVHLAHF